MDIIICLDDRNGMLFHHRRQSRDREVIRDMLQECAGRKLLVSPFSAGLFEKNEDMLHDFHWNLHTTPSWKNQDQLRFLLSWFHAPVPRRNITEQRNIVHLLPD